MQVLASSRPLSSIAYVPGLPSVVIRFGYPWQCVQACAIRPNRTPPPMRWSQEVAGRPAAYAIIEMVTSLPVITVNS